MSEIFVHRSSAEGETEIQRSVYNNVYIFFSGSIELYSGHHILCYILLFENNKVV